MCLPGELAQYAENVWKRFPEVFLALGSPDLESNYDNPERWCWRMTETQSAKVIEIRLPAGQCKFAKWAVPTYFKAIPWQLCGPEADLGDEQVLLAMETIAGRTAHANGWTAQCVQRKTQTRISNEGRLFEDSMESTRQSSRSCSGATTQGSQYESVTPPRSVDTFLSRRFTNGEQRPPPAKHSSSQLACRRCLAISNVRTKGLTSEAPGTVRRRPDLDRVAGICPL